MNRFGNGEEPEVYRPQVTVATGLRNIDGIREGVSMGHARGPGELAEGA